MWLELSKMKSELTGNLLGGALLGDILSRLQQAATAWQQGHQVSHLNFHWASGGL
jgi:hypothetical protein